MSASSQADPDFDQFSAWALSDPEAAIVELDRHIVAQDGLSSFIPLGWHLIEGASTPYVSNWHIDAICEHLMGVSAGHIKRLAIAVPPRHMKSVSVSVTWPAFDWIDRPWRRFLYASYAHALSIRDSVRCRRILASDWYRKRWGESHNLTEDQNTKIRFDNDKSGFRLSTSVTGMLTGEGADVIVVDDAHNVLEAESEKKRNRVLEWWDEAMSSRLNDQKTGAYVLIQQRVHERDLLGHVMSKESEDWTYLCLPAEFEPDHPHRWFRDPRKETGELLWPAHVPRKELDRLKARLGIYAAAGQLQQRPSPREGGIFKRSWFPIVEVAPHDTRWVRGWDLAGSEKKLIKSDPDYTASVKVGWSPSAQRWIIGHAERFREEPHEVENRMLRRAEADGTQVPIQLPQDPGAAGKMWAQRLLVVLNRFSTYADPVTGDKLARAMGWAGRAGAKMVWILKGDWNDDFLTELTSFPTGGHDDQVDAASSAFDRLVNNTFGIMGFYEAQLTGKGVDVGSLKSPYQIDQERIAAERVQRGADSAGQTAAATEGESNIEALAAALLGKNTR